MLPTDWIFFVFVLIFLPSILIGLVGCLRTYGSVLKAQNKSTNELVRNPKGLSGGCGIIRVQNPKGTNKSNLHSSWDLGWDSFFVIIFSSYINYLHYLLITADVLIRIGFGRDLGLLMLPWVRLVSTSRLPLLLQKKNNTAVETKSNGWSTTPPPLTYPPQK